jgi:YesN/AraC family two-component response regulator
MLRAALLLEEDFQEVREAADGLDAVRIVRDYRPDVVVLDITMPVMDGAQAGALIRRIYPATRIVVFSGVVYEKPDWADACVVKGSDTDLRRLISSARVA